ncbi:MAG: Trk system potassium uptake protein TrkH [Chlamydiae bacterium]|nr:Trk system potassium uptake protein TrkH [Chlamydiota bacterium]
MFREISKIVGTFLWGFSLTLVLPLLIGVYFEFYVEPEYHPQPHSTMAFLISIGVCCLLAACFSLYGRLSTARLFRRESLAAVVLIWVLTPALAAMPFVFSGTLSNPVQAYFEATSGITTTGASLLTPKKYNAEGQEIPYERIVKLELETEYIWYGTVEPVRNDQGEIIREGIEAVSKPILFWRSFLQWLGGLGIIVLFVAILPALGVGGRLLFHSEMPGPMKEALTPRIKETAIVLWKIYVGLSLIQFALLIFTNSALPTFDAVCITLSTISTGGFTVINGSIGAYNNNATEIVVLIFMMVGSINFSLYYYSLRGKFYRFYDTELIVYIVVITLSSLFVASNLVGSIEYSTQGLEKEVYNVSDAMRIGFFQVISAQTSSGFAVANYDQWPYPLQSLMLILIYLGGMAGSTAGGMKMIRYIMLFRIAKDKIELLFRPETVRSFRIGNRTVDTGAAITVLVFFLTVIFMAVLGTFLLTLDGLDPESALTVITSTINNSGMGFREAGPTDSYAFLSEFGLMLTSLWMMMGRLEFFTVLVVLVPEFWKRD